VDCLASSRLASQVSARHDALGVNAPRGERLSRSLGPKCTAATKSSRALGPPITRRNALDPRTRARARARVGSRLQHAACVLSSAVDQKNLINERLHLPHGRYPHCLSRVSLVIVCYQRRDFSYPSPFLGYMRRRFEPRWDKRVCFARAFLRSFRRGDSGLQIGLAGCTCLLFASTDVDRSETIDQSVLPP